ncbi:NUDIX domain-containing protein [Leisingera sp. M523]|uniref:NUDIX domain-containing protein n=1 Tax=Leisingera sp. M523 TaxID=2867013 RepID=UPI0021A4FE50|nr:NUDIX domain-containing protein [Leisingera sp. M523]UWQ28331.1 NUDIX domain-containing protein [Leisingera sp. M523]
MTQVTLSVIIGRFQPFHKGHRKLFEHASQISDQTLTLIGSAFRPRSEKNAFKWTERADFITTAMKSAGCTADITCLPLIDTLYDDKTWAGNVRTAIDLHLRTQGIARADARIVLVGHDKDESSRYLRWFPELEAVSVEAERNGSTVLNATDMRAGLFLDKAPVAKLRDTFGAVETDQVVSWMEQNTGAVAQIRAEAAYNQAYRENYRKAVATFGHEIPADCADAVVVQNGHILLVERAKAPGQGLYALPGGHLQKETAQEAAIRELIEETRLNIPRKLLEGRIAARQVFDHPDRSERGWVRTEAFKFELIDGKAQEKVKGADDAKRAFWMPVNQLTPDVMFEDHFDIIQALVPNVPFAYSSVLMSRMH